MSLPSLGCSWIFENFAWGHGDMAMIQHSFWALWFPGYRISTSRIFGFLGKTKHTFRVDGSNGSHFLRRSIMIHLCLCPFGKNGGAGLVYHLSSLPVVGICKLVSSTINQWEFGTSKTSMTWIPWKASVLPFSSHDLSSMVPLYTQQPLQELVIHAPLVGQEPRRTRRTRRARRSGVQVDRWSWSDSAKKWWCSGWFNDV